MFCAPAGVRSQIRRLKVYYFIHLSYKCVLFCTGGRSRILICGFGDQYSTIELRPYFVVLLSYDPSPQVLQTYASTKLA